MNVEALIVPGEVCLASASERGAAVVRVLSFGEEEEIRTRDSAKKKDDVGDDDGDVDSFFNADL